MKKLLILLFCFPALLSAQQADFPRDTSYTVRSTYQKLHQQYPEIEAVKAVLPEGVVHQEKIYRRLGSRKLHADVFYPEQKSSTGYPAVLLIHGGGWRAGDRSLMVPLAQQLAAQGYVTVAAEYRLSLEAPYPAAVQDLKTALRWMRAHAKDFQIDSEHIAVLGCSAGAQLAALIGTTPHMEKLEGEGFEKYSSGVQAIVNIDGVLAFKHPESEEGAVAAQWLGGTYEEVPEIWEEASALSHTDAHTPPVLYIASSYPRFHAGKGDMIKILKQHHIYYESYTLEGSPHSFWLFHPWFEPTLSYVSDFLGKVLKEK